MNVETRPPWCSDFSLPKLPVVPTISMPNRRALQRPPKPTTRALGAAEYLPDSSDVADVVSTVVRKRGRPPKKQQQQQAVPRSHVAKDNIEASKEVSEEDENGNVEDIDKKDESGNIEDIDKEDESGNIEDVDHEDEEEGEEGGEDDGNAANEVDKKQRCFFSNNEDQAMLNSLLASKRNGEQGDNAGYKTAVWHRVVKAVNGASKSKVSRTKSQCQNRFDLFKRIWKSWNSHLAHTSGWGQRPDGLPIADKEKWIEHNIEHKNACNRFKKRLPPFKNELEEILGGALATGENAVDIEDLLNGEIESENESTRSENGMDSCSDLPGLSTLVTAGTTQTPSAPPTSSTASTSDSSAPKSSTRKPEKKLETLARVPPLTERKRASTNAAIAASKRQKKPDGQQQLRDVLDKAANFTDGAMKYFNKLNEASNHSVVSTSTNPAVDATKLYYRKFSAEFSNEEELNILTAFGTDRMMTEVWINASERAQRAFLNRWSGKTPQLLPSTWPQGSMSTRGSTGDSDEPGR